MSDFKKIKTELRKFSKDRNWDQFHSPKNLLLAMVGEVGELAEALQWLTDAEIKKIMKKNPEIVADELADVLLYLIRLADKLEVDLKKAVNNKIKKNKLKYPVNKSKGKHQKYDKL